MKMILSSLFVMFYASIFSQDSINDYYEEITSGSEFRSALGSDSKTKFKFQKDVKIYVFGEKNDTLMLELNKIIAELNDLIETVNIEIVSDSTKSNINIYFGSGEYFRSQRSEKFIHNLSKIAQGFALRAPPIAASVFNSSNASSSVIVCNIFRLALGPFSSLARPELIES